jgi:hypothetical protein
MIQKAFCTSKKGKNTYYVTYLNCLFECFDFVHDVSNGSIGSILHRFHLSFVGLDCGGQGSRVSGRRGLFRGSSLFFQYTCLCLTFVLKCLQRAKSKSAKVAASCRSISCASALAASLELAIFVWFSDAELVVDSI